MARGKRCPQCRTYYTWDHWGTGGGSVFANGGTVQLCSHGCKSAFESLSGSNRGRSSSRSGDSSSGVVGILALSMTIMRLLTLGLYKGTKWAGKSKANKRKAKKWLKILAVVYAIPIVLVLLFSFGVLGKKKYDQVQESKAKAVSAIQIVSDSKEQSSFPTYLQKNWQIVLQDKFEKRKQVVVTESKLLYAHKYYSTITGIQTISQGGQLLFSGTGKHDDKIASCGGSIKNITDTSLILFTTGCQNEQGKTNWDFVLVDGGTATQTMDSSLANANTDKVSIPVSLQGVWQATDQDCENLENASKNTFIIAGDAIVQILNNDQKAFYDVKTSKDGNSIEWTGFTYSIRDVRKCSGVISPMDSSWLFNVECERGPRSKSSLLYLCNRQKEVTVDSLFGTPSKPAPTKSNSKKSNPSNKKKQKKSNHRRERKTK
jgi:hypothetical protein